MRRATPIYLAVFLFFAIGGLLLVTHPGPAQARGVHYEAAASPFSSHDPLPEPDDGALLGDDDGDGDRGTGDDDAPGETVKHQSGKLSSGSQGGKTAVWVWIRYSTWLMIP